MFSLRVGATCGVVPTNTSATPDVTGATCGAVPANPSAATDVTRGFNVISSVSFSYLYID
jgi:hypothetical protein